MDKVTKTFYIGKSAFDRLQESGNNLNINEINFFSTKGKQDDWIVSHWPPVKVKVTVEVIK